MMKSPNNGDDRNDGDGFWNDWIEGNHGIVRDLRTYPDQRGSHSGPAKQWPRAHHGR